MLLHHLLPLQSMRWPQNGNHPLNHGVNQRNVPVEKYLICLRTTSGLIATVVETCDANDAFRYAVPYQVIIVNEMYRYATNVIKKWKKEPGSGEHYPFGVDVDLPDEWSELEDLPDEITFHGQHGQREFQKNINNHRNLRLQ